MALGLFATSLLPLSYSGQLESQKLWPCLSIPFVGWVLVWGLKWGGTEEGGGEEASRESTTRLLRESSSPGSNSTARLLLSPQEHFN